MAAYTTIDDPEAYFQTVIYTGNGSANNAITLPGDTDMQPDLVWIKNRDATDSHCIFDSVRGATKLLSSDATSAEATDADTLDSFASDGFQVDADVKVNTNTEKYVAWCWKESATAGFDIVSYTGSGSAKTEAHSLSAVPHLMIFKNRTSDSTNWLVYHHKTSTSPEDDYLTLETTDAVGATTSFLDDTAPTSSVFTVGANNNANESSSAQITYLWTEKQGFSKFGSHTGYGNVDGPFIYTGFRPAYVIVKKTSGADAWTLVDNKRGDFPSMNPIDQELYPGATTVEYSEGTGIDFLSNGFKIRSDGGWGNASGATYATIAFAEAPFVNSNGVPCNAR